MSIRDLSELNVTADQIDKRIAWPVYPHLKDDELTLLQSERKSILRGLARQRNGWPTGDRVCTDKEIIDDAKAGLTQLIGEDGCTKEMKLMRDAVVSIDGEALNTIDQNMKVSRRRLLLLAGAYVTAGAAVVTGGVAAIKRHAKKDRAPQAGTEQKDKGR